MRDVEPEGPADEPWEQAIEPEYVDTAEVHEAGPGYNLCFSNAGVDNPWRQVGFKTMQAEVGTAPARSPSSRSLDAEGKDDKQISDIEALAGKGCDALIVSPNTTATLTPAVEEACAKGVPVIVFDRGVNTDCPVTFINPIGGYAFGADGAEFLVDEGRAGRQGAGAADPARRRRARDPLRRGAGDLRRERARVVGVEFTDGDAAKTKTIVTDYIQRYGSIDGIWMDAGATAVAAVEAFEDAGPRFRRSSARTSRTSCRSGRTTSSPPSRRPTPPTSGARRSSPR